MPIRRLMATTLLLLLSQTGYANAEALTGFRFSTMRIVLLEKDKAGAFAELENGNTSPFLIQSWLVPADRQSGLPADKNPAVTMPFMVTPPLHRLEAGKRYRWRIQRVGSEGLPSDRESVFYVALKAIPATDKHVKENGEFVLSPVIYQKLLYRPAAIGTLRTDEVSDKASFRQEGNQLVVRNESPLYMTFATLQVGHYALPDSFTKWCRLLVNSATRCRVMSKAMWCGGC